jgi:hypothetical protein
MFIKDKINNAIWLNYFNKCINTKDTILFYFYGKYYDKKELDWIKRNRKLA